jgi:hypothetical protein
LIVVIAVAGLISGREAAEGEYLVIQDLPAEGRRSHPADN